MRITLTTGTRYCDGDNVWHEPGETFDCPEDEAGALLRPGSAVLAEQSMTAQED